MGKKKKSQRGNGKQTQVAAQQVMPQLLAIGAEVAPILPAVTSLDGTATYSKEVGVREAIAWVFEHMGDRAVNLENALSPGCWWFLQSCRRDKWLKRAFYQHIWPKLATTAVRVRAITLPAYEQTDYEMLEDNNRLLQRLLQRPKTDE